MFVLDVPVGKEEVSPEKNKEEDTGRDMEAESGGHLSTSFEMG